MQNCLLPPQLNMDSSRNTARDFQCPVLGCEASYSVSADLQLHINHQHLFLSNPPQPTILHANQSPARPQHVDRPFPLPQQGQQISNAYAAQQPRLTPAQQNQLIAQAFNILAQPSHTAQQAKEIPNLNAYSAPSRHSATQQTQVGANAYNYRPQPPNTSQRTPPVATIYNGRPQPSNYVQQTQRTQSLNAVQQAQRTQPSNPTPQRAPQGHQTSSRPAISSVTGMHPPASTRNQFAGPTSPISNIATSPVNQPSSISPRLLAFQGQNTNNTQSLRCIWPSNAESFLKTLLIRHSILAVPLPKIDPLKLSVVFKEFRESIGVDFMGMGTGDPRILTIFGNKIMEIQHVTMGEMLDDRKRQKREAARKQRAHDFPMSSTASDHPMNQPTVLSPIATPPPTPVISNAPKQITIKECWDSRNADDQIKIFCQLIRSAKDSERMAAEWEKWNTEKREKKRRASEAFGQGLVIERHFEQTRNKIPAFTPPVEDQAEDLDSMIERRVHEARLKRQREKEMTEMKANQKAEEEASIKRMKMTAP